jgi:hypothetical protein
MKRKSRKPSERRVPRTARQDRRSDRAPSSAPRTLKQYLAMSPESQDEWDQVCQVPARMRSGKKSLRKVSLELGLKPRDVVRLGRPAFRKTRNGRYAAKTIDRLLRVVILPVDEGVVEIAINNSRLGPPISDYWNALHWFLRRGDASELLTFKGRSFKDARGKRVRFLTDLNKLSKLASAGVLSFESLYGGLR